MWQSIPIGLSSIPPKHQFEASLLVVTTRRQALFCIANGREKNIVLSKVSHCHTINEQALLNSITNL
jgi:hypothetical protein